jgi:hypothetical protein
MIVEANVPINGSKTSIWTVISNIRNSADIIRGIDKIVILNESSNGLVGLKWQVTRMFFGKPATIEKMITDAIENNFYTTRAEMDGLYF